MIFCKIIQIYYKIPSQVRTILNFMSVDED
jgi:hypothetical protein